MATKTKKTAPVADSSATTTVVAQTNVPKAKGPKAKPLASTIEPVTSDVLAMAAIGKMNVDEKLAEIGKQAGNARTAYAALGKLRWAMEVEIDTSKAKTNITTVLRGVVNAAGKRLVSDGTISNTGYAAKVWQLVADGVLTEAEYDGLCFGECYQIVRALSKKSARQLKPADVAIILRDNPDKLHDELESISHRGIGVAEYEAENKRVLDAANAAAAKAIADAAAADAGHAQGGNSGLPSLVNPPAAPAAGTPPVNPPAAPAAGKAPAAGTPPVNPPAAPAAGNPPVTPPATPGNVVNMPQQQPTAPKTPKGAKTEAEVLEMIDAVEVAIGELSTEEQLRTADRVFKLAALLAEALKETPAEEQVEATAPKSKKKAA